MRTTTSRHLAELTEPYAPVRQMTISSPSTNTNFEHLITSLPDTPDRETIISELDGAALPSSATDILLILLTWHSTSINLW